MQGGFFRQMKDSLTTALIGELKAVFGTDTRRIEHALAVLDFAEQIRAAEGGDAEVIRAAAILHDIGIPEAERRYGSSAGKYQEMEGPPIARKICRIHGMRDEDIEHVCRIVGSHHSALDIDTLEFRVLWDADWLVNFEDVFGRSGASDRKERIQKTFKTATGRAIALKRLVQS